MRPAEIRMGGDAFSSGDWDRRRAEQWRRCQRRQCTEDNAVSGDEDGRHADTVDGSGGEAVSGDENGRCTA